MVKEQKKKVWVFNGTRAPFPSGVFSTRQKAESWILENELVGCLTAYPIDTPVYEWAIDEGYFEPSKPEQKQSDFIQSFNSAHLEHYHYTEDGRIVG